MLFLIRKEQKHAKFTGERASADDEAASDYPEMVKGRQETKEFPSKYSSLWTTPPATRRGQKIYMQILNADCLVVFLPPLTTSLMQPFDQEFIATVKQFYHQQVRSSTETQVELATMEMVMSDIKTEDNPNTPPPPANQNEDKNTTTPPPAEMSVMIFWRQSTVKNADDFLLTSWDKDSEATVNHAWHLLVPNLCAPPPETVIQPLAEASTSRRFTRIDAARSARSSLKHRTRSI
ncbi:hypothetical protein Pmani_008721 [Petrolisthes manimaculis]|uniref:DDE-1 domain-containing protein n=1 Tax=Petrolisthes manimaculis TaxID=1843537 RepID=A0AAE1Q8D8_9EUCA|nr:hypothetical protein Pmani_008721 [Petrolisthes manimaculis]